MSYTITPRKRPWQILASPLGHFAGGTRKPASATWTHCDGLVSSFTKDVEACERPINARSETASTSGMFRGALRAPRCIVPADAFDELKAMADGKQRYAIARTDGAPLAFASLWEGWRHHQRRELAHLHDYDD